MYAFLYLCLLCGNNYDCSPIPLLAYAFVRTNPD